MGKLKIYSCTEKLIERCTSYFKKVMQDPVVICTYNDIISGEGDFIVVLYNNRRNIEDICWYHSIHYNNVKTCQLLLVPVSIDTEGLRALNFNGPLHYFATKINHETEEIEVLRNIHHGDLAEVITSLLKVSSTKQDLIAVNRRILFC